MVGTILGIIGGMVAVGMLAAAILYTLKLKKLVSVLPRTPDGTQSRTRVSPELAASRVTAPVTTPSVPTKHMVADSVFTQVAGPRNATISLAALSNYLVGRGDMPLDKVQSLFNQLECVPQISNTSKHDSRNAPVYPTALRGRRSHPTRIVAL